MRSEEVRLRGYRDTDFAQMLAITLDVWGYYDYLPPQAAVATATHFLSKHLATAGFALVAEQDGRIAGFILGEMEPLRVRRIRYWFRKIAALPAIYATRHGAHQFREYRNTQVLNRRLLKQAGGHFDAALSLFAVRADMQGKGVGSALFGAFQEYLRENGAERYYLFTDSSSSYLFYEKRGLARAAGEVYPWKSFHRGVPDYPETYFVYVGELPRK